MHLYKLQLNWAARRAGKAKSEDFPELTISAPVEFGGDAQTWTPEHLLVASTASCLMTTFIAIAEISKLQLFSYRSGAEGKLEKAPEGGYWISQIVLTPEVAVLAGNEEKALRLLSKAEKNCFISNSLRTAVRVEPTVVARSSENEVAA